MSLIARLLPAPDYKNGHALKTSWESRSSLAPSALTRLNDLATEDLNGLKGHKAIPVQWISEVTEDGVTLGVHSEMLDRLPEYQRYIPSFKHTSANYICRGVFIFSKHIGFYSLSVFFTLTCEFV